MSRAWNGLVVASVVGLVAALLQVAPVAAAEDAHEFVGMTPVRVADTRYGTGVPIGKVAPGGTLSVPVAGSYGVPSDARAVSVNATVTQPGGSGYVTVYPCGTPRPLASNLNFTTGQTVPNAVVVKAGAGGAVCLYASTWAHLVVDLNGYFPTTADYSGIVPARAADTRYGTGVPQGRVPAGQTLAVPVAGLYGIPADATSVAANVTVTQPTWNGYVTVWPCGEPRPFASNLNFVAGQTVPNAAIAGIGENGSICLYTTAATHLVVDVGGSFTEDAGYWPLVPERAFDTREDGGTKLPTRHELVLTIAEPGELIAAVLNVTVTQPDGPGYITVHPCSDEVPLASNLNFVRGQTVPNMVIAPVNAQGEVCFYTSATTHLLADVQGVFPATDPDVPVQLGVGLDFNCVLMDGGSVKCWGNNEGGQLGNAEASFYSATPVPVDGISDALGVSARYTSACAVLQDGTAECWGDGKGPRPVQVPGLESVAQVSIGADHKCAVLQDGTVRCWGENSYGQLGDDTTVPSPTAVTAIGITDAVRVFAGFTRTCAILGDGTVQCWGNNDDGELGDGTRIDRTRPVAVPGVTGVVDVAGGSSHTCALKLDGAVQCWGAHNNGQFGTEPPMDFPVGEPFTVPGVENGVSIYAYMYETCSAVAEGSTRCWGRGDSVYFPWTSGAGPIAIDGYEDVVDVRMGYQHVCALTKSGLVLCHGNNVYGQLGNGTTLDRSWAAPVIGL